MCRLIGAMVEFEISCRCLRADLTIDFVAKLMQGY